MVCYIRRLMITNAILKDKQYLSTNQFLWWDFTEYDENKFVSPEIVIKSL